MIDLLLGVPKQLNDLLTRLSATWAAKLDTLHTAYTATRAGYLDKLNLTGKAVDDAVWTNALAAKVAAIGTSGMPVIASGTFATKTTKSYSTSLTGVSAYFDSLIYRFCSDCCTPIGVVNMTTTYETKLSLTGKGYIDFLVVSHSYGGYSTIVKVTIDGVVAMEKTLYAGTSGTWSVMALIGDLASTPAANQGEIHREQLFLECIPYFSSFVVEVKASGGSTQDATLYYHGRKTA